MESKRKKILVCMSGGVDSSVAAALLVREGCNVTGAFMVNYDEQRTGNNEHGTISCWRNDYRDALRVAAKLGISLIKLDFTREYKEMVLDYMFAEYEKGRTPNPDVECNKFVKFGVWLEKAHELGFDTIATGHYASIQIVKQLNTKTYHLIQAKDENKDQTYFLHQLNQEQLSHTMFPLGGYTKDEVRQLAREFDLPTAEKEESMGICFVGEVPMKEFLQERIEKKPGNIVTSTGEIVGEHEGLAFYTIGQRHIGLQSMVNGLRSGDMEPLYVVRKNSEKNELVVGSEDDPMLWATEIQLEDVHWISGQEPMFPLKCKVRLRHRQPLQQAMVRDQRSNIIITFKKLQRAVTPGQFAVFYIGNHCLGGGIIH